MRMILIAFILSTPLVFATPTPVELENQIDRSQMLLEQHLMAKPHLKQKHIDHWLQSLGSDDNKHNVFITAISQIADEKPHLIESLHNLSFQKAPDILQLQLHSVLELPRDRKLESRIIQNKNLSRYLTKICALSTSPHLFPFYIENQGSLPCPFHQFDIRPPTRAQLEDLIHNTPSARDYKDGLYYRKPMLFQFCRTHRNYSCLTLMKNSDGQWVRNSDGSLWNQGKLSLSRQGKKYNEFNGDTPAGIYTLDSVMPHANKQEIYGRFRRLIMEFIPNSSNEALTRSLLPDSNSFATWWREASVARDMGRSALRIHGTLRRNDDKTTTFYPFYPTWGCVASLESNYDGVNYIDQRLLLDKLMIESGFQPLYENETRIRSLFYIVEIDSQKAPVTLEDLEELGLE